MDRDQRAVTDALADPEVRRIMREFPGSEVVKPSLLANIRGAVPDSPDRPPEAPPGAEAPDAAPAVLDAADGLAEAAEAMVDWFRENEPGRLDRQGWKRVLYAIDVYRAERPGDQDQDKG